MCVCRRHTQHKRSARLAQIHGSHLLSYWQALVAAEVDPARIAQHHIARKVSAPLWAVLRATVEAGAAGHAACIELARCCKPVQQHLQPVALN